MSVNVIIHQKTLILIKPSNSSIQENIYIEQEQKICTFADEISMIRQLKAVIFFLDSKSEYHSFIMMRKRRPLDCGFPIIRTFEENRIKSTFRIEVPSNLTNIVEGLIGSTVQINCELGFEDKNCRLFLKARCIGNITN
jgi:hypothetical protein